MAAVAMIVIFDIDHEVRLVSGSTSYSADLLGVSQHARLCTPILPEMQDVQETESTVRSNLCIASFSNHINNDSGTDWSGETSGSLGTTK